MKWKQRALEAEREVEILREMMQHGPHQVLRVQVTYSSGAKRFECVVTLTGGADGAEVIAGQLVGDAINTYCDLTRRRDDAGGEELT